MPIGIALIIVFKAPKDFKVLKVLNILFSGGGGSSCALRSLHFA